MILNRSKVIMFRGTGRRHGEKTMPFIEKFLGKSVEIPKDYRYAIAQNLWMKSENEIILLGLTEPFLVMAGGFKDVDSIVDDGEIVDEGTAVLFAITGKILYIDTPIKGQILFNPEIKQNPNLVMEDTYGKGWLFSIKPGKTESEVLHQFATADEYTESLKGSEGLKNPEGIKGGVSGICKAVYTGIGGQKI
jgi:glycine cleavage system H protein